jgi:hypothetical protein
VRGWVLTDGNGARFSQNSLSRGDWADAGDASVVPVVPWGRGISHVNISFGMRE